MSKDLETVTAENKKYSDRIGYSNPLYVSGEAVRLMKLAHQKFPSMLANSSPEAASLLRHLGVVENKESVKRDWNVTIDRQGNIVPEASLTKTELLPERGTIMHSFNYAAVDRSTAPTSVLNNMRALDILSSAARGDLGTNFDAVLDNALPGWRSKEGRGFNAVASNTPVPTPLQIANDEQLTIGERARRLGCSQATIAGMSAKGRTFG